MSGPGSDTLPPFDKWLLNPIENDRSRNDGTTQSEQSIQAQEAQLRAACIRVHHNLEIIHHQTGKQPVAQIDAIGYLS